MLSNFVSTAIAFFTSTAPFAPQSSGIAKSLEGRKIEAVYQTKIGGRDYYLIKFDYFARSPDGKYAGYLKKSFFWGHSTELHQLNDVSSSSSPEVPVSSVDFEETTLPDGRLKFNSEIVEGNQWLINTDGSLKLRRIDQARGFSLKKILSKARVHELPEVREPEYLFRLPDETYVSVDSGKHSPGYDFRVFRGVPGTMTQLEVVNVMRSRDGGTTDILLANGDSIYSPTPLQPNRKSLYRTQSGEITSLEKVDKNSVDFATFGIPGLGAKAPRIVSPYTIVATVKFCAEAYGPN